MKKPVKTLATSVSSDNDVLGADQVLYRFLVDSLTEYAVFAVSPTGIVISWNAGAEKTFGYTQVEILGKSFDVIFTPEDKVAGAQHDRWHVRKDASRFWGTNTVQPLYNAGGRLLGFTKLVRDSTQSHLALEELSDSEQQLRLLIESVSDYAIFSLALDGLIKNWNAGAEKVFGYDQKEIIGRNFSILFSADDIAAGVPAAELHKATLHGFTDVERWLVRRDGSRFLASGKLSQLKRDAAGELRGFVKIAHDITHTHAAAQDLRHQARYDELTELPNRRTFYEHVQRAIALMKRRPSMLLPFCLSMSIISSWRTTGTATSWRTSCLRSPRGGSNGASVRWMSSRVSAVTSSRSCSMRSAAFPMPMRSPIASGSRCGNP
jgi:PAS domain S-box-containing protein